MKAILYQLLYAVCGAFLGYQLNPSEWDEGFDEGIRYAVHKYATGRMLKVPEVTMPANFVDCWFVSVILPQPSIFIGDKGGNSLVTGCVFTNEPISPVRVKHDAFATWERMNEVKTKEESK